MNDNLKQFILYTAPNGEVRVDVLLQNESVWLTQKAIAELFGVQRPAITKHLKNIFESEELQENLVSSILEHTTPKEGSNKLFLTFRLHLLWRGLGRGFSQKKPQPFLMPFVNCGNITTRNNSPLLEGWPKVGVVITQTPLYTTSANTFKAETTKVE